MESNMKTLKICLCFLCLLHFCAVGFPQDSGATFFMETEIWKDVKGFEGIYQISNLGNVKSFKKSITIILKPVIGGNGYLCINLSKNSQPITHNIHRLLAIHFIDNPENKRTVNHKDGNKLNNHLSNLEWATDSENNKHAFDLKLRKPRKSIIKILAINQVSIIEFDSVKECANYLSVATRSVRQAYSHPCKCKGFNIYKL